MKIPTGLQVLIFPSQPGELYELVRLDGEGITVPIAGWRCVGEPIRPVGYVNAEGLVALQEDKENQPYKFTVAQQQSEEAAAPVYLGYPPEKIAELLRFDTGMLSHHMENEALEDVLAFFALRPELGTQECTRAELMNIFTEGHNRGFVAATDVLEIEMIQREINAEEKEMAIEGTRLTALKETFRNLPQLASEDTREQVADQAMVLFVQQEMQTTMGEKRRLGKKGWWRTGADGCSAHHLEECLEAQLRKPSPDWASVANYAGMLLIKEALEKSDE